MPALNWSFGHPKQTIQLTYQRQEKHDTIALVGVLHPNLMANFGIKKKLFVAEIYAQKIVNYFYPVKKYKKIPDFPPCFENLTLIKPDNIRILEIINKIKSSSEFIDKITLIEEYKNSVSFEIRFQSYDHNFTKEELQEIRRKILENLDKSLGVKLKL